MAHALRAAALAAGVALASAQGPMPSSCAGTPNMLPVWAGQPQLVNKTANGIKMVAQPSPDYDAPLLVLHLYGSAYDMGLAYGQLLKAEITDVLPKVWAYMQEQVNGSLPASWPTAIKQALETYGLEAALDLTYDLTKPFTPQHYLDTMQGLADGSGLPYRNLTWMSMIPELIKAQCSLAGSWGQATPDGNLVQLRALDWGTDGPFQQYPALITWHPLAGDGQAFTTLTWAGLLGAITGWGSNGLAISEKVWLSSSSLDSIAGIPFNYLLQDILQYDNDTDQVLSRIAAAERTCSIWIGIGDAGLLDSHGPSFKAVQYSWEQINIFNDANFPTCTYHTRMKDALYANKHVDQCGDQCIDGVFQALYPGSGAAGKGNLTAVNYFRYITALDQTGNMHIAVMDFGSSTLYVSNASPGDGHGNNVTNAFDRPFLAFNASQLWATQLGDY